MGRAYAKFSGVLAALMVVGTTAGVMLASPASAAPSCTTTCFVSPSGSDSASGTTAGTPLLTINAALTQVSPGGTINLAAGTYTEQLIISKAVTITGAGQASTTIQGPASTLADDTCVPDPPSVGQAVRAVVTLCGAPSSTVVITGVTVSGGAAGEDADGGCQPKIGGIYVSDGYTLNLSQSTVTNVYNSNAGAWGCQQGVAIQAGSVSRGVSGTLIADHVTVLDYQKGGIVVDNKGSTGTITNSVIEGDQLAGLSTQIAMNGIEIGDGASASIDSTQISGNKCDDTPAGCGANPFTQVQSGGVLLFNDPGTAPAPTVSFTNNDITDNDIGIYTNDYSGTTTISGNTINGNRDEGVVLDEGSAVVTNNSISSNGEYGVLAVQGDVPATPGADTATLTGNTIDANPTAGVAVDDLNPSDGFTTNLTLHRNALTSPFGVNNLTPASSTVNATCNWWGAADGPGPVGTGSGTNVSTGVNFAGFLTTSNLNGPCPSAPAAPTITGVTSAGFNTATVSFTPGSDGGSPITSFTVTCTVINDTNPVSVTGSGSPITLTGLLGGNPYQCTVTATNAFGVSPPSGESGIVFPASKPPTTGGPPPCTTPPSAPLDPTATAGNAQATVTWKQPVSGCFVGYIVTPYIGSAAQPAQLFNSLATTEIVTALTNGTAYAFTVAAENGFVTGPASVFTKSVTIGAPTAATVLKISRVAKGALRVTFAAPRNNGAAVTSYTATCTSSNGGVAKSKTGKSSPLTVSGLTAGKTYKCAVKAKNSRGTGPTSTMSHTASA